MSRSHSLLSQSDDYWIPDKSWILPTGQLDPPPFYPVDLGPVVTSITLIIVFRDTSSFSPYKVYYRLKWQDPLNLRIPKTHWLPRFYMNVQRTKTEYEVLREQDSWIQSTSRWSFHYWQYFTRIFDRVWQHPPWSPIKE